MTALIGNPLLLTSAPSGGDAYQIEKSLRFNSGDTPYLSRTPNIGNQRTWTWSGWIKRTQIGVGCNIFGANSASSDTGYLSIHFGSDDTITSSGNNTIWRVTTQKFKDPNAWYHLVFVADTSNAIADERFRWYCNGERITSFSTNNAITQNNAIGINTAGIHTMSRYPTSGGHAGYMSADVQFIDGQALSPAAFGSFDSTGNWNPKTFALPAPNDGTTWSTAATVSGWDNTYTLDRAFNGNIDVDGSLNYAAAGTGSWEPNDPIPFNQGVRIFADFDTRPATADEGWVKVTTDISGEVQINGPIGGNVSPSGANMKWYTVVEGKGELTKIVLSSPAQGSGYINRLYAVEVDGVILIDGKTDPTTRNNLNDGRKWSDDCPKDSGTYGTYAADVLKWFDGDINNHGFVAHSNGDTDCNFGFEFVPSGSTVEIYCYKNANGGSIEFNGTDISPPAFADRVFWRTLTTNSSPSDTLTLKVNTSASQSDDTGFSAIRVDGHILIDSASDNSFHLKFNDTSLNIYLGKDTLNGKIADATGGTPLLATTDDYGLTLGSGNATDSFSSDLKFAFAGNNATGSSLDISGSGHSCTVTNATLVTDQSQFYGSSINFGGDAKITTPTHSDFDLGTTNWTVEFWSRPSETSSQSVLVSMGDDGSGSSGIIIGYKGTNLQSYGKNTSAWNLFSGANLGPESVGNWTHYALTRQGSTFRFFANGTVMDTKTHAGDVGQDVNAFTIGVGQLGAVGADAYIHGNIQDFRYYNHGSSAPKYTAAFTAPTRNDWAVNNINHASSTGVTTGGVWNTAFKDGSSGTYNGADDHVISTGTSHTTSANQNKLYIDTGGLGDAYELTLTKTGGSNNLYIADTNDASTSSIPLLLNNVTTAIFTSAGANLNGTLYSHDRYIQVTGSSSGNVTFSITGVLDLDVGTSSSPGGIDSLTDTPTNYGTDEGAGGEVRGNYCTINPLDHGASAAATITQGNLTINSGSSNWKTYRGTMGVSTGKWYYEVYWDGGGETANFGIIGTEKHLGLDAIEGNGGWAFAFKNRDLHAGAADVADYLPTGPAQNKAGWFGVAIDMDAGKLWGHYEGTWGSNSGVGNPATGANAGATNLSGTVCPAWSGYYNGEANFNFGQRPWKFTCPTGFKAWCTQNLPDLFGANDDTNDPSKYFANILWQDNSQTISGLGFAPDLVWHKERDGDRSHGWYDRIRGATKILDSENGNAEATEVQGLTAFTSDGFTVGSHSSVDDSQVAWCWDAGTAANTTDLDDGTIDISSGNQWVNAQAGFSITKYTGNNTADATLSHGLAVPPELIIIKCLSGADGNAGSHWVVKHIGLSMTNTSSDSHMYLNMDIAKASNDHGTVINHASDNTLVQFKNGSGSPYLHHVNGSHNYIMYAWTGIPSYSKFGKFTGTGAGGNFIYTGFDVQFLMVKSLGSDDWIVNDKARDFNGTYGNDASIQVNDYAEEYTSSSMNVFLLSNGFMFNGGTHNASSTDYIYMAFAAHPFKTSRAQ